MKAYFTINKNVFLLSHPKALCCCVDLTSESLQSENFIRECVFSFHVHECAIFLVQRS